MARIPDTELERLKEEVSVERLVEASGVVLKKAGKDIQASDGAQLAGAGGLRRRRPGAAEPDH